MTASNFEVVEVPFVKEPEEAPFPVHASAASETASNCIPYTPTREQMSFTTFNGSALILYGAFCDLHRPAYIRHHPVAPPRDVFAPWVWEAVHRNTAGDNHVQVSVVPRMACSFNETRWHGTVRGFSRFAAQMADGRSTNRLVPPLSEALRDRERAIAARWQRNASLASAPATLRRLRREARALSRCARPDHPYTPYLTPPHPIADPH